MRTGRIVLVAVGAVMALTALGALIAGGVLLWAHGTQRDADGFYVSPTYELTSDGYALTTDDLAVAPHPGDWFPGEGELDVRVTVTPVDRDQELFVGIAEAGALAEVFAAVAHDQVEDVLGPGRDDVTTTERAGGPLGAPPATLEGLWETSTQGDGVQTLTWPLERGTWALAVLNADGSPSIEVLATAAVRTDLVLAGGIILLVLGAIGAALGTVLVVVGAAGVGSTTGLTPSMGGAPVVLSAHLDEDLSRWRWLVKWLLALPHAVALAFLWMAFVLLTAVAGVAILFTGRYPRGIFDFNVGVLRWTWRVTHYAFGVLGTDRYPPFTLGAAPDYPATLEVAYPEHLSRGLVLVKWWLLAIPHYVIVGLLTGGLVSWTTDVAGPGGWQVASGGGLIGVLVLIAGVMLLFTGRYPQDLFDLVVGLQRWVYRVTVYAALMTDEYPPFRLDPGGTEPSGRPPEPPAPAPEDAASPRELQPS